MDKDRKTGYKLHLQRLIFSGGSATRSIKFPLKPIHEPSIPLKEDFENSIIADDLKIRGSVNLPDYQRKPNRYTLADFWIDSLRAGVIWQPNGTALTDFVKKFFNEPTPGELIFKAAAKKNKKLRFFKKTEFTKNIILADPKRSSGRPSGFRSQLLQAVKAEYKKEGQELRPEAQKLLDKVISDFYDKSGRLRLEGETAQNEYWLREFDIDKNRLKKKAASTSELAKLTFFILPQLINLDENSTVQDLLEQRERLFGEDDLAGLLGLESNFNALSHYFNYGFQFLSEEKINAFFQAFAERVTVIEKYEKEIGEALEFLSTRAQKLDYPQVDRVWSEYRSIFGGKIQSWFSNYQRRERELKEQTEKLQSGVESALGLIEKTLRESPEARSNAAELLPLLKRVEETLDSHTSALQNQDTYEVFMDLLANARRGLNRFYQGYIKEEDDDTFANEHRELKDFYAPIYRPMSFFAEQKLKENEKIVSQTVYIIKDGLQIAEKFLGDNQAAFNPAVTFEQVKKKGETAETAYRRALQTLWGRIANKQLNSAEFKTKYGEILRGSLSNDDLWAKMRAHPQKYCFYQGPYAKGTLNQVGLSSDNHLADLKKLVDDLYCFALSTRNISIFDNKGLLQDKIELLKTLIALFIRFNTNEQFNVAGLDLTNFERARKYLELFNLKRLTKNEAAYFYQSLIFSELRGAITVFTKEKYTSRYVLQVMKTTNKFPLFYFSKAKSLDTNDLKLNEKGESGKDLLSQKPHYYCIAINQKLKTNKKVQSSPFLRLDKQKTELVGLKEADRKRLLKISTLPYQQQFLERFLSPVGDWKKVNLTLSEWSFIVEKNFNIAWDKQTARPIFTQTGETKLFVSIPFQIRAEIDKADAGLTKLAARRPDHPILGIDVGEYGVGWVLARFSDNSANILRKGFIPDKNIAAIQKNFAAIQRRARKGVFNVSSTAVAEVRENAIGAVRNQIHDILTQERAGVIYEYNISNFETGSGRVTKVYNTVKRADVSLDTDADKQQHAHVWGAYTKLPGTHLSAYASSYICFACARSLYELNQKDAGQAEVAARDGNILTIKTHKGELHGFTKDKKITVAYTFRETKEGLKEFLKLVRDFARPPVTPKSETLRKFAPHLSEQLLKQLARKRGGSAIFVCPFADCHHVADADIQAALMMAIRGYLNWSKQAKSDDTGKKDYLPKTQDFLGKLKDRPSLAKSFYPRMEEDS